jgi:hypothetical protein
MWAGSPGASTVSNTAVWVAFKNTNFSFEKPTNGMHRRWLVVVVSA